MRKMRFSGKAAATASLISQLDARSTPSGFSSPMRTPAPARPARSSPAIVVSNRLGAVDRKSADLPRQFAEAFRGGHVVRLVVQPVEEVGDAPASIRREELLHRLAGEVAILGVAHVRARGADDAQVVRQQLLRVERAERRQQHAPRQVPRGPEQQQGVGGEAHSVGAFLPLGVCRPCHALPDAALQHSPGQAEIIPRMLPLPFCPSARRCRTPS